MIDSFLPEPVMLGIVYNLLLSLTLMVESQDSQKQDIYEKSEFHGEHSQK